MTIKSKERIDDEIESYRALLLHWAEVAAQGDWPVGFYQMVRDRTDALICLLDEVPESRRWEIEYVVDRFEALQRSILN